MRVALDREAGDDRIRIVRILNVAVAPTLQPQFLPRLVFDPEVDQFGPDLGIYDIARSGMAGEAAYRLKGRRLPRATTADDAVKVAAKVNALTRQEAAVHGKPAHHRDASGNILLYPNARIAVLQRQLQGIEAGALHLVARDFAVASGVATERRECVTIRVQEAGEVLRLAKTEPLDPHATEAPAVGVRIEIGIGNLAVAAL